MSVYSTRLGHTVLDPQTAFSLNFFRFMTIISLTAWSGEMRLREHLRRRYKMG